jgi:photosystem II stability/assembly factor-like uncharacterized protein/PKD repeat protein
MKKFLLFLLIPLSIAAFSQQKEELYEPFSPTLRPAYHEGLPDFVKMTFQSDVNFFALEKMFQDYKKLEKTSDKHDKTLENHENTDGTSRWNIPLKSGESREGVENPYETYFERWKRAYQPFVQEDGTIKLPKYADFQRQLQAENKLATQRAKLRSGAANWVNIGPKETFFLKDDNTNQPACPWQVNIYAFDIAKSNSNILFAATETGAVFKTIDKGMNWTVCANDFNFGGAATALEIHPTDARIVFLGVNNNIFKSIDGGNTWYSVFDLNGLSPHDIAIMPENPEIMLVAGDKGLFRSTDGGANWTKILSNPCFDIEVAPLPINSGQVITNTVFTLQYNGTEVQFMKSTNSGESFTVKSGFINTKTGRLAVTAADGNRIYGLLTTASAPKLIKSLDAGETWIIENPAFCTAGISDAAGGQGFYDLSIAASQTNADQLIFGLCNVHKSVDAGVSATGVGGYCGSFSVHPDLQEVKAINGDVWVATDGGLTFSSDFFTNTANAMARNNGIYATDFWGFSQGWNEDIMVGGRYHNGNTAMADFYPAGKAIRMGGAEAGTGYVLHGRSRHAIFSDLGDGWILPETFAARSTGRFVYTKFPTEDAYGADASELVIDPRYYKHNYMGRDTVLWKTLDGGNTFIRLSIFPSKIRRIELSRSNPDVLYLTTDGGLYKSKDAGTTFTRQTLPPSKTGYNAEISLSPTNENVLFVAFRNVGGTSSGKVFRSNDGGATWIDLTTAMLDNLKIKWVVFTENTEGGVYIAAQESRGRVFYRDDTMNNWEDFSTNLPASMDIMRLLPFYRDAKLRVVGNRGIWETALVNTNIKPLIQPSVDKQMSNCGRDTFYFEDYSIVKHAGATWKWTFSPTPQYVSSLTARNPKVVFGKAGKYSITMTLTDGSGNTETKSYTDFVTVLDGCGATPLAGNALKLQAVTDFVRTPPLNITTNRMTLSAWIKPNGSQIDFAGIVTSASSGVSGLNFLAGNRLGYHWQNNAATYTFVGGPIVPLNVWSHVALVIAPDSAVLYLNGVPYKRTAAHTVTPFTLGFNIGNDRALINRTYKGLIDEVCIHNKSLTTNEIRELMHLTRTPSLENALVAYYQMDESDGEIIDKAGANHGALAGAAARTPSTAPVGAGTSFRMNVTNGGVKTFTNTGLTMTLPTTGTYPNGDVVVTLLNNQPLEKPNNSTASARYWVVNNFGANASFSTPTAWSFDGFGAVSAAEAAAPNVFKLYKRLATADSLTWGNSIALANSATAGANGVIGFSSNTGITAFNQQLFITKEGSTAIGDKGEMVEIMVYPNPVSKNGLLHVKTDKTDDWEIFLYDVSGRLIRKAAFKNETTLSVVDLSSGVYFYQIKSPRFMKFDTVVLK